jgi:hypothetical protein
LATEKRQSDESGEELLSGNAVAENKYVTKIAFILT